LLASKLKTRSLTIHPKNELQGGKRGKMKLAIFGATGGTGKQLVEQALAAGS